MKNFEKNVLILPLMVISGVIGKALDNVNTLKQRTVEGHLVACYTIHCTENQYFQPCKENYTYDTCYRCPAGTINRTPINSLDWDYSLGNAVCASVSCSCPPESIPTINNTCLTTGIKSCVCNLAENQYGPDYQACNFFEGTCVAGTELNQSGNCVICKDGYFKSHDGKGLCVKHNKCLPPHQEVAFPGNKTADVVCKPRLKNTSSTVIYPEYVSPSRVPTDTYRTNVTTFTPTVDATKTVVPDNNRVDNGEENKALEIYLPVLLVIIILIAPIIALVIYCKKNTGNQGRCSSVFRRFSDLSDIIVAYCLSQNNFQTKTDSQTEFPNVAYDAVDKCFSHDTHVKQQFDGTTQQFEEPPNREQNGKQRQDEHHENAGLKTDRTNTTSQACNANTGTQTSFLSTDIHGDESIDPYYTPEIDLLESNSDLHEKTRNDELQNELTEELQKDPTKEFQKEITKGEPKKNLAANEPKNELKNKELQEKTPKEVPNERIKSEQRKKPAIDKPETELKNNELQKETTKDELTKEETNDGHQKESINNLKKDPTKDEIHTQPKDIPINNGSKKEMAGSSENDSKHAEKKRKPVQEVKPMHQENESRNRNEAIEQVNNNEASARLLISTAPSSHPHETLLRSDVDALHVDSFIDQEDDSTTEE